MDPKDEKAPVIVKFLIPLKALLRPLPNVLMSVLILVLVDLRLLPGALASESDDSMKCILEIILIPYMIFPPHVLPENLLSKDPSFLVGPKKPIFIVLN